MSNCIISFSIIVFISQICQDKATSIELEKNDPSKFDLPVGVWIGSRVDGRDNTRDPIRIEVKPILGGIGKTEELQVKTPNSLYRGYFVQVYEQERKVYVRQYANSVKGKFVHLEARIQDKKIVWQSPIPDSKSRLISEKISDTKWVRTQQRLNDDGKTWNMLFKDELTLLKE